MERDYEITIDKPVEDVFAVLAAVERYHEWLPPSETYIRCELESDEPIKQGSKFVDIQSHGVKMPGEVHIYDPPHRIGFRQRFAAPLGAEVRVRMEYTLKPDGDRTHVVRHHVFQMPLLLKPMELVLRSKIIAENDRIVACLKTAAESAAHPR